MSLISALVEEGLTAGQQVGNALVAQELFERARLEVAAIEDGVVGKRRDVRSDAPAAS
jgi:hypothetical protein